MIFSYTQTVKELVDESIYNLGIKSYLNGQISTHKSLVIDNWREYKVISDQNSNIIKIPLLHLALSRNNFMRSPQALEEVVSCSCLYFEEFGICKHIVAVCCDLQREFFEIDGKKNISKIDQNILGKIFEVESYSKVRKLQANLDSYFAKSQTQNLKWWEDFIFELETEKNTYKEFLDGLADYFRIINRNYDTEKKLLFLVYLTLRLKGKYWIDFWISIFDSFSEQSKNRIITNIFKIRNHGLTTSFDNKINNWISSFDDTQKQSILENFQIEFENSPKIWLDFVIASRYTVFLREHINQFDTNTLLELIPILEDDRESIEIKIMKQINVWSDFLQTGNYEELIEVLTKWATFGRSDYFFESLKHIRSLHHKKSKLMLALAKIE